MKFKYINLKNTPLLLGIIILFPILLLSGCGSHKEASNVVKVGIIDGPDTAEWETAQKIALKKYNLHIELIKLADYTLPNEALNSGEIDANSFQHMPFLTAQMKARGYKLMSIAKTFLYPIAIYSNKIKNLSQLQDHARIGIPNDPSNEARALLLLQAAHLITLKKDADINATVADIISNPKHLAITELSGAQLPRALNDLTAAVINNDFATPAGLDPNTALFIENKNSPYMNIIAIRPADQYKKKIQEMVKAFQTPEVKAVAEKISAGNAIAGW